MYKRLVPSHTCSECGKHIEELEYMWVGSCTILCEKCVNKDDEQEDKEDEK